MADQNRNRTLMPQRHERRFLFLMIKLSVLFSLAPCSTWSFKQFIKIIFLFVSSLNLHEIRI